MGDGRTVTRNLSQRSDTGDAVREWDWNRLLTPRIVFMMLPLVGLLVTVYAYPLKQWELTWRHNAAWSHGYLVPLLAVVVAHFRLKERPPRRLEPCIWGLGLIMAGCVFRIWARTMMFGYPGQVTFLLVAAGTVLLVLGWEVFKAVWVAVVYLGLMIPWNVKYYEGVALPLQRFAAGVTEQALWLFGYERVSPDVLRQWLQMHADEGARWVSREVNVLNLASGPLTVAEACSGLHLLFAFVALGVLMAFMYRRAWWERALIMISSVPIAVFCNVVRVTLMALASDHLHFERLAVETGGSTWLPAFVLSMFDGATVAAQVESLRQAVLNPESWLHQSFGFAMLALAFGLMWLELRFIDLFFVEDEGPTDEEGGQAVGAEPSGSPAAGEASS